MGEGWMQKEKWTDGRTYVREHHAVSYDGGGTEYSDYKYLCTHCDAEGTGTPAKVKHKIGCSP